MATKDKYDFIIDLLNNERLTSIQKEKVLILAKKEIKNHVNDNLNLENRVSKIEEKLNLGSQHTNNLVSNKVKKTTTNEKGDLKVEKNIAHLTYENPIALYNFLFAYNQNLILKTTCHEIDDDDILDRLNEFCKVSVYNFEEHYKLIKTEFKNLVSMYTINSKIYALFQAYLFGPKKTWSSNHISMSWANENLLKWARDNGGKVPNPGTNFIEKHKNVGFELNKPFVSSLTGLYINSFSEFVLFFKSLFHIKSDNSLKGLIMIRNTNEKFEEWADINCEHAEFWSNLQLFTDVDKLMQAYTKIIKLIKTVVDENKITERPQIKVSFYEEHNATIISIHHLNTYYRTNLSTIINTRPFGNSLRSIIEDQINGLCNFYIRADFGNNEFANVNMWDNEERKSSTLVDFKGVEYILKFIK